MNTVFGFCGPVGSGKSSVSKCFASRIGAGWNSFGNTVRQIAADRGLPLTRESLQVVGASLIVDEREEFCRRVLSGAAQSGTQPMVIDGIRHRAVLDLIRTLVPTQTVVCVYVDSAPALRLERLMQRDGLSEADLRRIQAHSTEVEVERDLKSIADLVVSNCGSIEESEEQLITWARERNLLASRPLS